MKVVGCFTIDGSCIEEKYNPNETILEFKKRIKNKVDIPTYCQKLFLDDGKTELLDEKTFSEYNCDKECLGLSLINLNKLNVVIHFKTYEFKHVLKGSDSILNLKEVFLKDMNVNFSLEKIEVLNSGKILNDKQFIEEFIKGFGSLNFEIKILEKDYIIITINNVINSATFVVDPLTTVGEIKKMYVSKEGNEGYNQWMCDSCVLKDHQILKDIDEGLDLEIQANPTYR